jgi:Predicted nucleoside-diphosphate-sugar epimerases
MESPLSLVAGGTGLVGSHVIKVLSKKPGTQIILARSFDSEIPQNAEKLIINFDSLDSIEFRFKNPIDHVYLCLGKRLSTHELGYMQHSSRESFKLVDFDYSLAIAKLANGYGARSIALVSAVGAQEGSFNYYFHIKGKIENEIRKIGYEKVCFARPGHLLGARKDFRGYEIPILESGLRFATPFMQGPFKNFRQIEAKQVAKSMVMDLLDKKKGESYLYYEDFLKTETFE